MVNLTSDDLEMPLHTLNGKRMSLEKKIGVNFMNTAGKWTSNIFREYTSEKYKLCYTLFDRKEYEQMEEMEFSLDVEIEFGHERSWNIYLTSGTESVSSTIHNPGLFTNVIKIDHGQKHIAEFSIEENYLLSTDDMPCDSTANYTYSKDGTTRSGMGSILPGLSTLLPALTLSFGHLSPNLTLSWLAPGGKGIGCLDNCLKNQFISGEKYNTSSACQISGFQNVEGLEPCKTLENAKVALYKYVRSSVQSVIKDIPIPQSLKTCEKKCHRSCNQFWYTFKQTEEKQIFSFGKTTLELRNPQKFRTVTTQQWSYSALDMAADIGGYVGALLGISLLSVSHLIIQPLQRMLETQGQK
ncbi:unnamed protein product [Cyprideis torosa]|uniref:Uncharacterized protein n=1 Tax=Cyprideis torosa TaxID=163714 RepID=A0A7R8WIQ8_9CRUS|nr:unnamed protein product [Cyprideis torosa]CAG0894775.1 unnamed protein product [Cyprideis torosa]